nr:MAG TPA: hypothetical protein [Caudoviricetes sp.]
MTYLDYRCTIRVSNEGGMKNEFNKYTRKFK